MNQLRIICPCLLAIMIGCVSAPIMPFQQTEFETISKTEVPLGVLESFRKETRDPGIRSYARGRTENSEIIYRITTSGGSMYYFLEDGEWVHAVI